MTTLLQKLHHFFTGMLHLVIQGGHLVYRIIICPRSPRHKEDDYRHEYILNTILSGFIGLILLFGISILLTRMHHGPGSFQIPLAIYSIFALVFIGLLVLSRIGYFKASSFIFLGSYFIITGYAALMYGIELPMVFISYVIIVVITSVLISARASIIVALVIALTLVFLGYAQVHGITHPDTTWRAVPILVSDSIQIGIAIFLITLIAWLSNREIDQSLHRARTSEYLLTQERNNLEQTVLERTQEIKSLQAEKVAQLYRSAEFGRLSSGLFHDLMNPLHALIGSIETLKSNPADTHQVDTYLEKSLRASKRMGTFITSIQKQLSRHELDEYFSCAEEIREAVDILGFKARSHQVTLTITKLDDAILFGNPLIFHQIIINLVANAIDAYQHTTSTEKEVTISCTDQHDQVILVVTDTGCGIPQELLESIFDPFFTTKDLYQGTGLGLSTTKTNVQEHFQGTIQVTSTPYQGTVFTVTFPLRS